jgi:ribosome-associated translation inhibitor RaiA
MIYNLCNERSFTTKESEMNENEKERAEGKVSKIKQHLKRNAVRYTVAIVSAITQGVIAGLVVNHRYVQRIRDAEDHTAWIDELVAQDEEWLDQYLEQRYEDYVAWHNEAIPVDEPNPISLEDFKEWYDDDVVGDMF